VVAVHVVGTVAEGSSSTATAADWAAVLDAAGRAPWPGDVFLNQIGNGIPLRPVDLAAQIIGGISWIDYTDWPMQYIDLAPNLVPLAPELMVPLLSGGFQAFTQVCFGYPLGYGNQPPQFLPVNGLHVPGGYATSLFTTVDILHTAGMVLPYPMTDLGYDAATAVQRDSFGRAVYAAPMFGIQVGRGWYFWACGTQRGKYIIGSIYGAFIELAVELPQLFSPNGAVSGAVGPSPSPHEVPGSKVEQSVTPPPPPASPGGSREGVLIAAGGLALGLGLLLSGMEVMRS